MSVKTMMDNLAEACVIQKSSNTRDQLLRYLNQAGREIWNSMDLPGSVFEQAFDVPSGTNSAQAFITLPWYCEGIRAARWPINGAKITVQDKYPHYHATPWKQRLLDWRIVDRTPLSTSLTIESELNFSWHVSQSETFNITISGETTNVTSVTETLVCLPGTTTITSVNQWKDGGIRSITKDKILTADVTVIDANSQVVALIPARQEKANNILVQITDNYAPVSFIPGVIVEILYKAPYQELYFDNDTFFNASLEDALVWRARANYETLKTDDGALNRARALAGKASEILSRLLQNQESEQEMELNVSRNRYFGIQRAVKNYGLYGGTIGDNAIGYVAGGGGGGGGGGGQPGPPGPAPAGTGIVSVVNGTLTTPETLDVMLADNPPVMRGALGLGDSAVLDVGTTGSTVAAGDDSRIVGALQKTGGTMSGIIAMGGNKITDLAYPTVSTDAASKAYVDAGGLGTFLPLTGGTLSGVLAMGSNKITGLATPTVGTDAATKAYADSAGVGTFLPLAGGTMSGAIALGGFKITGLGTPTLSADAATKAYADSIGSGVYLPLAGGTMSGAIAMGGFKITGLDTPTLGADAVTKTYADAIGTGVFLPLAGGTMAGVLSMGGNKITNLGTPTVGTDAVTKTYADAVGAGVFLPLAGGTMSGAIAMGSFSITGLGAPSSGGDATTKTYVDTADGLRLLLAGGTMSGAIAMGTNKITGLGTPTVSTDAATMGYVDTQDALKLSLSGGTMSGAIAMGTFKITGLGTPTVGTDAATKAYADLMLPLTGGTMSGAIAMGTAKITGLGTPTTSTDASTMGYVDTTVANYLPLTGGTLTGNLLFNTTTVYGLRLNNLTTTQRDATTAAAGALIWNITTSRVNRYDGSTWSAGWTKLEGDTMTGSLGFSGTTNAGLILNSLTTTQRDALSSPSAGNIVWNTTTTRANIYDGSAWTAGWVKLAGDTMTGSLVVTGSVTATTDVILNSDAGLIKLGASSDTLIGRAAANFCEMRNGTNQTGFTFYDTYIDSSNYSRGGTKWNGTAFQIFSEKLGSPTLRNINFVVGGTTVQAISSTGMTITGTMVVTSNLESGNRFQITSNSMWKSATDGIWTALNAAQTGFTRLNLGGTTSSFPALAVNGTQIDIKLADNSALTDLGLKNVVGQTGYHEMVEMTAPAAGAANTARIYAVDNGAGKTQLMVIFSSGAAQQIAIQP